jgi:hypothetical protein
MNYYRIYGLDRAGRITFGDHFECRDDGHAMEIGRGLLGRFPAVEIWQEARRVGAVLPDNCETRLPPGALRGGLPPPPGARHG